MNTYVVKDYVFHWIGAVPKDNSGGQNRVRDVDIAKSDVGKRHTSLCGTMILNPVEFGWSVLKRPLHSEDQ